MLSEGSLSSRGTCVLCFLLLFAVAAGAQDPYIPGGLDCWETPCSSTSVSFCDNPIPAGFFGPGCDAFAGTIKFGAQFPGTPDTIVERLGPMVLFDPGETATVPIEIVQLQLEGCSPITVDCPGGPQNWEVFMGLSAVPPPPGQMVATRTHTNGGYFIYDIYVQPLFTFVQDVPPVPLILEFDTGLEGRPPEQLFGMGEEIPWVNEVGPQLQLEGVNACGANFAPGVRETSKGKNSGFQCLDKVCHAGVSETQCTFIDADATRCRSGACCFPGKAKDRCRVLRPGSQPTQTAQVKCHSHGGTYFGDGTNCDDTDGDNIPDVFEKNDCCATGSSCNLPTSPALEDTDGDLVSDSAERKAGTDPCDPLSF